MVVFLLTGNAPAILVVTLLILCYLTAIDLWREGLPFLWKSWWVLLVLLLNVVGYAAFRIWLAVHRHRHRHRRRAA